MMYAQTMMGVIQSKKINIPYTYEIYKSTKEIPEAWEKLSGNNIFLSLPYLVVLESTAPENMICHFIGVFHHKELVAIAISQYLNLNQTNTYGHRGKQDESAIRNFLFKHCTSQVLVVGNSMLTGQHAFGMKEGADKTAIFNSLKSAAEQLRKGFKKEGIKIHLTIFKDFGTHECIDFKTANFKSSYQFSVQPNMVFLLRKEWKSMQDYVASLSKKYRSQFKRCCSKSSIIEKRELELDEIVNNEERIHELYLNVSHNAPFNTFYLTKNHFSEFKKKLGEKFIFIGYFIDEKLVGFITLINNSSALDTYFLGYDNSIQKEKMLYLNMLYNMIEHAIGNGYEEIVFGRTALEIKSSVGAQPQKMIGFMQHSNFFLNKLLPFFFSYFEPEVSWKERNPFVDEVAESV